MSTHEELKKARWALHVQMNELRRRDSEIEGRIRELGQQAALEVIRQIPRWTAYVHTFDLVDLEPDLNDDYEDVDEHPLRVALDDVVSTYGAIPFGNHTVVLQYEPDGTKLTGNIHPMLSFAREHKLVIRLQNADIVDMLEQRMLAILNLIDAEN